MDTNEQAHEALISAKEALTVGSLADQCQDGSPAAEMHAAYNLKGLAECWLKEEYATPLSKQDETNQRKNVEASLAVVNFFLDRANQSPDSQLVETLRTAVAYQTNRGDEVLEAASRVDHAQWKRFVSTYQSERVIPGSTIFEDYGTHLSKKEQEKVSRGTFNTERLEKVLARTEGNTAVYDVNAEIAPKFRADNFVQMHESYAELPEQEADNNRLNVAIIADVVLAAVPEVGHTRVYNTQEAFRA